MLLLVDGRDGSKELLPYLADVATPAMLNSGDVAFTGNGPAGDLMVGVEVKTVGDFLSSESSGRLKSQMERMRADYDENWLLLIGQYGSDTRGELTVVRENRWVKFRRYPVVHYSYLTAFIVEAQTIGFRYFNAPDYAQAAHWLKIVARWWEKPWDKHRAMRKFDVSARAALMPHPDPMTDFLAGVAQAFPNVGYERAMAVGAALDGFEDFGSLSVADWAALPGIGKTIARNIHGAIHGRRQRKTG